MQSNLLDRKPITFESKGLTSKQNIKVEINFAKPGHGIVFQLPGEVDIPANADSVVNTLRNVVLGQSSNRLCIVEHFLCATSLFGLNDLLVKVDGPEMPLGDGSAKIWFDLFEANGLKPQATEATIELPEVITCGKGDRLLLAIPDESFSVTYLMDWNHPKIGKRWQTWNSSMAPLEIFNARTFGSLKEHEMLGLTEDVVSLTEDSFTQPLHFEDEPVRHKLLDLIGDLALCGFNPLMIKARFVGIKSGHELDVVMAKKLRIAISK